MSIAPQTPPRTFRTSIGLRLAVTVVGALGSVALHNIALAWPVRIAGWVLLAVAVAAVYLTDWRRRLELHADRLVLQGGPRREIPFRAIASWSIPLGTKLILELTEDHPQPKAALHLARWHKQGDMNAAIITAIRVAGATFEREGQVNRVKWKD